MSKYVAAALVSFLCFVSAQGASADEDVSQVYPTFIERWILFETNRAATDYAKMPVPDASSGYPNWEPPPGGEHDCPPMAYNRQLGEAARYHAQDMADQDYFSHDSIDGTSFADRVQRFGYSGGMGENIAMGQTTAQEVVAGWMQSEGHRHNILACVYAGVTWKELGTGYGRAADNPTGPRYWVQDFGDGSAQDQFFLPFLPSGIGYRKNNAQAYFGVTFYDDSGSAPDEIQVVIGDECHPLQREAGQAHMGTYSAIVSPVPSHEDSYFFQAVDSLGGVHYYPERGSLYLRTAFASDDRELGERVAPPCAVDLDPGLGGGGGGGGDEGGSGGDTTSTRDRGGCSVAAGGASLPGLLLGLFGLLGLRRR